MFHTTTNDTVTPAELVCTENTFTETTLRYEPDVWKTSTKSGSV